MNGTPFTNSHPDAATLGAYHDGELRGFARAEVEAHLAACPRCRHDLDDLDALTAALRALPQIEPTPEIHGAVLARVTATRPRRARRRGWALAAALAALAAMLAGYDILMMPRSSVYTPAAMRSAAPHGLQSTPAGSYAPAVAQPSQARSPLAAAQGAGRSQPSPAEQSRNAAPLFGAQAGSGPQATAVHGSGPLTGSGGTVPYTVDARLIARTGEVDMRVRDVQRAFNAVGAVAAREGGDVADSNNSASSATHGTYAATLTLRVPAAHFQATMDALAALPHGTLAERSTSLDVTDRYRDLQAHLQALQATRDQLLALMHRAGNIRDAMAVLDRLTGVDTDIDAVQGQILASANSVMLSTITVNLAPEPHRQIIMTPKRRGQAAGWHPGRDVTNAVANLEQALEAIITIAIYAGVYLALPALLVALALLAWKLRQRDLHAM